MPFQQPSLPGEGFLFLEEKIEYLMHIFGPQVGAFMHLGYVLVGQLYLVGFIEKHLIEEMAHLFVHLVQVAVFYLLDRVVPPVEQEYEDGVLHILKIGLKPLLYGGWVA